MRVLLCGGGTGGHIYPALAIADELKRQFPACEILYVGTDKGLENKIVPQRGYELKRIKAEGMPRKNSLKMIKSGIDALEGMAEAKKIIKDFKPDLVLGTGGYVCGPVVLSAHHLKVPTFIHEQNALPGVTNKILSHVADKVFVNLADSKKYFKNQEKIIVAGLPVREEVLRTTKEEGCQYFGLSMEKPILLVSGGSRGARSINKAMAGAYKRLLAESDMQIIHSTGQNGFEETKKMLLDNGVDIVKFKDRVRLQPYLEQMEYALAAADVTVARAGATNLAEICACGLPAVLIPYPFASENHQEYNARSLVDNQAAVMILDKDLNAQKLAESILHILSDDELRKKMSINSAQMAKRDSLDEIVGYLKEYLT